MAAFVACGADEAEPGAGSSGVAASSSSGGSSGDAAAATSSGGPVDDGGGPTGRDVPIGMGGPSASSSSGTPDAAVGLQCTVDPPVQVAATACKAARIAVEPLGQIQPGAYTMTGYWSCAGFTAVAAHASIYVEDGLMGMRYARLETGGDAGSGPATAINGTWRLVVQSAGAMTRQDVCGMQADDQPESATFNYQSGILKIALADHDERWMFDGLQ